MAREQTSFAQARVVVVCLEPPPGRPLIYTGDARRSTESHTGSYSYPGWSLSIPNLQCKFTYQAGLRLQVLNRLQALGLHLLNHLYTTNEVNPAQVGRFTPSGNIPNNSYWGLSWGTFSKIGQLGSSN